MPGLGNFFLFEGRIENFSKAIRATPFKETLLDSYNLNIKFGCSGYKNYFTLPTTLGLKILPPIARLELKG